MYFYYRPYIGGPKTFGHVAEYIAKQKKKGRRLKELKKLRDKLEPLEDIEIPNQIRREFSEVPQFQADKLFEQYLEALANLASKSADISEELRKEQIQKKAWERARRKQLLTLLALLDEL